MEQVRAFASMLCVSAVGCCALKMLLPESALEKVLKVILSVFFLLCLIMPLRGFALDLPARDGLESAAAPAARELGRTYEEHLKQAVADNVTRVVSARLLRLGLEESEINIVTNVNMEEGGRIDISGIEVFLEGESARLAAKVRSCVEEELELACTVLTDHGAPQAGDRDARSGEDQENGG